MADSSSSLDAVLAHVDAQLDDSVERLFALLRIASISTDPAYAGECRKAADWLANELDGLGFDASVRPTEGHPMVVGHDKSQDGPSVLFYGHYDVQPVDPLSLWVHEPFEPAIGEENGRKVILARGASDDKGQLMTFVEACRAYKAVRGALPVNVTVLFEGEEEAGSRSLGPFLEATADELKADMALVCDTDMWDSETPSIVTMLRGLVGEEVVITAASRDLHSGMYGGAARNPIQVLGDIVASLRNSDGSVAIEGFYDDVAELPAHVAEQWQRLPFDGAAYLGEVGLGEPAGERGRSVLEQITSRPTCEINGISGGYTGDGFKTVIPSQASAKISFRLVGNQDPAKIREAFRAHVRARVPADCSVAFSSHGASPATTIPADGTFVTKALAALTDEWNKEAAIAGSGGSIPIVGDFKRKLGMDSLLIGFAQTDDRIHSPNEKYNLESYHRGIRSWVRILDRFGQT
ncbi:M20/M25/M40 family metallo-hydrolase [Pelagibacterium xiamenense]|uniref:M20/M25/M40 family metallo-hydrolase n=1 Tax=Pelagibacterium xiamenense TaxID=2901140 RepID=UPI001E312162|nr:M20/M25/M40 family metallo-hydrolase [Pelagibacterium xiamenense]MCD7060851.1 M20/M25/M40 family metallo-hydrolase [Pelagibacterium xiamenense]